jgi:hypothetical protein
MDSSVQGLQPHCKIISSRVFALTPVAQATVSRSKTRVIGKEAFVIDNNDGACWQSLGDAAARVIAKVRQP